MSLRFSLRLPPPERKQRYWKSAASRYGEGNSTKTTVAMKFSKPILDTTGPITDADLAAVRDAGFSEGEVAEILAHVARNVPTSYLNIAAGVDIVFLQVSFSEAE